MKNLMVNFRTLLLVLSFSLIYFYCNSQETKPSKKDRKEARKLEAEFNFKAVSSLLEGRRFVVKLEKELTRENIDINPLYNYLEVDSLNCRFFTEHKYYVLLRLVPDNPIVGNVVRWELDKDQKHLKHHLRFNINTWLGRFDVLITVETDKTASGYITNAGNDLQFQGYIKKL